MPLVDIHGAERAETDAATAQLGPDAKLEELAPRLASLGRIEVEFPKFRDGRGFTLARTLRERYSFTGDIRATGHFLPDQFLALISCGFTSFITPPEHEPAQFAAAAAAARQPGQLLRRTVLRAREAG